MVALKHVGRVKNTGHRCVVVFREIYDDNGHVSDSDHCLVFETENLPDAEHQDLMRIIESETAQSNGELFNVLARSRLGSGMAALNWLAASNRLRKFPTSNIELTPDSNTKLGLDTLNKIVTMQKAGASESDIENALRDDTDMPPRMLHDVTETLQNNSDAKQHITEDKSQPADGVLDNTAIAKQRLAQADTFKKQAEDLMKQAYELDPSLKPTRKATTKAPVTPKKPAAKK